MGRYKGRRVREREERRGSEKERERKGEREKKTERKGD